MKMLQAVIKPFKLTDVRDALEQLGIRGMTVTEVRGFGRQKGHSQLYRGSDYSAELLPKIALELAVPDPLVEPAVAAIVRSAATGKIGDGKIFVLPISDAIRIRTGERREIAL